MESYFNCQKSKWKDVLSEDIQILKKIKEKTTEIFSILERAKLMAIQGKIKSDLPGFFTFFFFYLFFFLHLYIFFFSFFFIFNNFFLFSLLFFFLKDRAKLESLSYSHPILVLDSIYTFFRFPKFDNIEETG